MNEFELETVVGAAYMVHMNMQFEHSIKNLAPALFVAAKNPEVENITIESVQEVVEQWIADIEQSSIEMLEQLAAMYVLGTEGIDALDDENAVIRGIDELKTKLKEQTGEDAFDRLGSK
jgi:hypothetical protein